MPKRPIGWKPTKPPGLEIPEPPEVPEVVPEVAPPVVEERPPLPEYIQPEQARELFGVTLEPGWQLHVRKEEITYVTPEKWEIFGEGEYFMSPEGKWYTAKELEWELAEERVVPQVELERTIAEIFPGEDINVLISSMWETPEIGIEAERERELARQAQEDFVERIQAAGRTAGTDALLQQLGFAPKQTDEFFFELPRDEVDFWVERYGGLNIVEKGWSSFLAGVGDVVSTAGGAARWLGYEDVGETLSTAGAELQQFAPPTERGDFEAIDLLDPLFYAEKVVRTIPFCLSLAPLAIGGFYGGAAVASATGLGTIGSWIVGGFAGAALSRPAESALEAGNTYDNAIAMGMTEKEAKEAADRVFRENMTLVGADAFEIAVALAPTPKWVPLRLVSMGLVRTVTIGGKVVIVGLAEGGEEIYQDMIQRRALGEEWQLDPIAKEVFAIGTIMGMGMGLGGHIISSIVSKSKDKMSPSLKKDFDDSVSDFKEEGFLPEQAELRALDIIAQTPEGERVVLEAIDDVKAEEAIPEVPEVVPEIKPPVVKEVKVPAIEEERVVYTEAGVPVSPDEPISQEVADIIPIVKDIGILERWVRPTRKVFERMGLYETYKGIQKAEVELGEAKKDFIKKLKEVSKLVDTKRRYLIFRELETPGSQVGLTFEEKRAVNFFREHFNKWADVLNLPQEKRLENYVTHIFEADIEEQLKAKYPLDPAIARALEYKAPKTIFNPFLQKRLGATTGLVEDPFAAASAYESRQLKVLYYEPWLQKIAAIANAKTIPPIARDYLKAYAARMTSQPSKLDVAINNTLQEFAGKIEKLPGGETFAKFLTRGNPSGMAAYNFTSAIYVLWLGFKFTSAIRNLSQHTLIMGETAPQDFATGIALRFTKEGRDVVNNHSLVWRSRRAAFVPGIDDSFAAKWSDKFRESALWMFRKADEQNVKDAYLAGYAEAKRLLPEADPQVWYDRGDEVAADTQYLYTQMNSMAISQSSAGRVFSILTTWVENWMELMTKWVSKRPSQVYLQYEKETGKTLPKKNWSQTYKAIGMYMVIVALGYLIKEETRLKAWEYTGLTSIRYLADVVGGDFPGLQVPGSAANMVAGFITDDERMLKTGWAGFKGSVTPGIVRQAINVAMGEKDWLTLLFYLEGRDWPIKQLKNKWEKGWRDYEALETTKERDEYRKNFPKIEAQMFITGKFTTLTTEEARREVLRIIEANKLDTELIDGYEKIFGVDTDKEFTDAKKLLGTVELDEEGKQKIKKDGELDYYTTSNFASDVNKLENVVGRPKIVKDGNPLAIEYLEAKDLFVQYESLTTDEARLLFRQQFPDVEAQLYLWGKVASFKNPKSAEILLGLMEKYNIPPESVPAFLDKPERYDELFTQKFKLQQQWFDLTTQYENYGNEESPAYIEDDEARKEARATLKDENPNWVADMRRIEGLDTDAPDVVIESYVEYGKTIDKHGASSAQAKLWRYNHPKLEEWGREEKEWSSLFDDETDLVEVSEKVSVWTVAVQWPEYEAEYEDYSEGQREDFWRWAKAQYKEYKKIGTEYIKTHDLVHYAMDRLARDAVRLGFIRRAHELAPEKAIGIWNDLSLAYVDYYMMEAKGFRQERYLIENPDFANAMHDLVGIDLPKADEVPAVQYDEIYEEWQKKFEILEGLADHESKYYVEDPDKRDEVREGMRFEEGIITEFGNAELKRRAYELFFPEEMVDTYADWYAVKRKDYEDDWFLMENIEFYKVMLKKGIFTERRDFTKVPTRRVWDKYQTYIGLPLGSIRLTYRLQNPDLDKWLVRTKDYTPAAGRGDKEADISGWEELVETAEEIEERLKELRE